MHLIAPTANLIANSDLHDALVPLLLRDEVAADYWGTIEKLAQMGFQGIEGAGPAAEGDLDEAKRGRERFDGLGIEITKRRDGFIEVISPIEGTPADLAERLSMTAAPDTNTEHTTHSSSATPKVWPTEFFGTSRILPSSPPTPRCAARAGGCWPVRRGNPEPVRRHCRTG